MNSHKAGSHSAAMLRRFAGCIVVIMTTSAGLAIAGFWWWPASFFAIPISIVAVREMSDGGILDFAPHLKGFVGERNVAAVLEMLGPEFQVVHGLDSGRGNVDHVVIGPTGVFAVETKNVAGRFALESGRLTLNGRSAHSIARQARAEAMVVRDCLRAAGEDIWVNALVVSAEAKVVGDFINYQNVMLLHVHSLRSYLQNRRARLSVSEVESAAAAVRAFIPKAHRAAARAGTV